MKTKLKLCPFCKDVPVPHCKGEAVEHKCRVVRQLFICSADEWNTRHDDNKVDTNVKRV